MSAELVRRLTGLIELDAGLPLGALTTPGRGQRGMIFGRYLAAYLMVGHFNFKVEEAARLLKRDRGTVTKALKVFAFLEGYSAWREAIKTVADLAKRFVEYGALRDAASAHIPAPVGRERKNDPLPTWARERYAIEIEAAAEMQIVGEVETRAAREADSIYLRHPAVKAITDDPDLNRLLGQPVVSVSLSPPEDALGRARSILMVPPTETEGGSMTMRLMLRGDGPNAISQATEARALIQRALLRRGFRLTGVAESFAARGYDDWRYVPLHVAQVR